QEAFTCTRSGLRSTASRWIRHSRCKASETATLSAATIQNTFGSNPDLHAPNPADQALLPLSDGLPPALGVTQHQAFVVDSLTIGGPTEADGGRRKSDRPMDAMV